MSLSYIYIPLGGSKSTKLKQFGSLAISFFFIFYWHGKTYGIFLWSFLNFLMVVSETIFFSNIINQKYFKSFVNEFKFYKLKKILKNL